MELTMRLIKKADIFPWVETVLGGKVVKSLRPNVHRMKTGQRADWIITAEVNRRKCRFYLRSDHGNAAERKDKILEREARVLRLLRKEGIPVPKIIACSTRRRAIIMEFVDGSNDPGGLHDPLEYQKIAGEFAAIMARWQAIPAVKFARIGLHLPEVAADYVLGELEELEKNFLSAAEEPLPLATFACRWLRRNIPPAPERPVLLQGDSGAGQFIFKKGRIRAVIDWEMASLGDPMRELAQMRVRNAWFPTESLSPYFLAYSKSVNKPLDLPKISYYSVRAALDNVVLLMPKVQQLDRELENAEWMALHAWAKLATVEMLAEAQSIALEPISMPMADQRRVSQVLKIIKKNVDIGHPPRRAKASGNYRRKMLQRLMAVVRNGVEIGSEIEALELADMESLLGWRPRSRREGNRALNAFVDAADASLDVVLIRYFYRHALREYALMRGGMGEHKHAKITPLSRLLAIPNETEAIDVINAKHAG